MSSNDNCQICLDHKYKYICPRCNIAYCSVSCYKDVKHIKCSEEFYKHCVEDELRGSGSRHHSSKSEMRKIYNILKRIRQTDAGISPEELDFDDTDESTQLNDSDDDGSDVDTGELDLGERLKGIDINNAEEVWKRLTKKERGEFQNMVASGDIMKLMPDYTPWWLQKSTPKIIELPPATTARENTIPNENELRLMPEIMKNIPKFDTICKKDPSHCVHYNLWNILTAYAVTVRYFRGEHLQNANEACAHFLNLCTTLKYATNFDDVEDAIISVEMEALSTNNKAIELMSWAQSTYGAAGFAIESRAQLQADARQLMSSRSNKLAALSDILSLFQVTKNILKDSTGTKEMEFQKLFALSNGMQEITRNKIQQLSKKITFYLSYVNREVNFTPM